MKRAIQALAWTFLALDAVALLFFLTWALSAGAREGESAYAMVFLFLAVGVVGGGGAMLVVSARRGSAPALGCATLVLGLPPAIAAGIWISNLL